MNLEQQINNRFVEELAKEVKGNQPRLSLKSWLEIFPEAENYLRFKRKDLERRAIEMAADIRKSFRQIARLFNDFAAWFLNEFVRVFYGEDYDKLLAEIKAIDYAFLPEPEGKDWFSREQIEETRQAFDRTGLEIKKDFAVCPFHPDKTPSLYVKNGWGFCFACGWRGDAIALLMARDNLNFKQAMNYLL